MEWHDLKTYWLWRKQEFLQLFLYKTSMFTNIYMTQGNLEMPYSMTQNFNPIYLRLNSKIISSIPAFLPPENPEAKDANFSYFSAVNFGLCIPRLKRKHNHWTTTKNMQPANQILQHLSKQQKTKPWYKQTAAKGDSFGQWKGPHKNSICLATKSTTHESRISGLLSLKLQGNDTRLTKGKDGFTWGC